MRALITTIIVTAVCLGVCSGLECWGCEPGQATCDTLVTVKCHQRQPSYCIKTVKEEGIWRGCSNKRPTMGSGCYDGYSYHGELGSSKRAYHRRTKGGNPEPLKCYCRTHRCNSGSLYRITQTLLLVPVIVYYF